MKRLLTVIKILVLLSAAAVAVLRLVSFKYEAALSPETLQLLFRLSIVFAAVLIVAGVVWIFLEKRLEKGNGAG